MNSNIITDLNELNGDVLQKVGENIVEHFQEKANYVKRIVVNYTTKEQILDDYDGLMFFDLELQALGEAVGQITEDKVDALYQFQKELHFVNKLLTIQKYYSQRGDFYKKRFFDTYTSPSLDRDELGLAKSGIMYMPPEEFLLFKEVFDEIFILE